MIAFRSLVCLLVFSAFVSAQIVAPIPRSVTGVVVPVPSPGQGILCPPSAFSLECSEGVIGLTSSGIDLTPFIGQNVKLTIASDGKACPRYSVLAVDTTPPATLALCGTPQGLGCPIRLRSGPGGISQHYLLISLSPDFIPLSVMKGGFLLGSPFFVIGSSGAGPFPPEGAAFNYVVPSDPSLIGIDFYLQAARRDVGPIGPWQFSNARCFAPIGFTVLCVEPSC